MINRERRIIPLRMAAGAENQTYSQPRASIGADNTLCKFRAECLIINPNRMLAFAKLIDSLKAQFPQENFNTAEFKQKVATDNHFISREKDIVLECTKCWSICVRAANR